MSLQRFIHLWLLLRRNRHANLNFFLRLPSSRTVSFSVLLLFCTLTATAQEEKVDYKPQINGTVRAKYEYEPDLDASRFEVRNARVSVSGNLLTPAFSYKAEIDLSDEGNIKMLDAYARYNILQFAAPERFNDKSQTLNFTIGQMRVPFTIDAHRSPHQQYFANRSFIAKQVGNVRDVGAMLSYRFLPDNPITLSAGLFNGSGLTNQKVWHDQMNYSAKAEFRFAKNWNFALSAQTTKPDSVRIHTYDAGLFFQNDRWHVEAEYLYKCYAHSSYDKVHAVDAFVNYDLPLRSRLFHKISFLGRYDYMTNYSDGKQLDANGLLTTTDYARQRLTGGVTLSLGTPFRSDIRLNYEKYFYHADGTPKESEQDKLVVEFMVRF